MDDLIVILAAVTTVSLISFMGILFISLKEALLRSILMALVSFASGSLIGGAFFHLLLEASARAESVWSTLSMVNVTDLRVRVPDFSIFY